MRYSVGSMATIATKIVTLPGGLTLSYAEVGDPHGVPVLFLHGFTDSWRSFEPILERVPASHHAVALTQRGHGDADRPREGYRPQDFAADVVAFMDAISIDRTVLVGHSMGSFVSQLVAAGHPHRVIGLLLISARMTLRVGQLWEMVSGLKDPIDPQFVERWVRSNVSGPVSGEVIATAVRESLKVPARVWQATVRGGFGTDPTESLDRISAPTLLIWGDQDSIPRSDQELILSRIRGARLVAYAGAGHASIRSSRIV